MMLKFKAGFRGGVEVRRGLLHLKKVLEQQTFELKNMRKL